LVDFVELFGRQQAVGQQGAVDESGALVADGDGAAAGEAPAAGADQVLQRLAQLVGGDRQQLAGVEVEQLRRLGAGRLLRGGFLALRGRLRLLGAALRLFLAQAEGLLEAFDEIHGAARGTVEGSNGGRAPTSGRRPGTFTEPDTWNSPR